MQERCPQTSYYFTQSLEYYDYDNIVITEIIIYLYIHKAVYKLTSMLSLSLDIEMMDFS